MHTEICVLPRVPSVPPCSHLRDVTALSHWQLALGPFPWPQESQSTLDAPSVRVFSLYLTAQLYFQRPPQLRIVNIFCVRQDECSPALEFRVWSSWDLLRPSRSAALGRQVGWGRDAGVLPESSSSFPSQAPGLPHRSPSPEREGTCADRWYYAYSLFLHIYEETCLQWKRLA